MLTLNSLASLYNIIIFYLLFKERITYYQCFGMMLMLCCVGLLSINGGSKHGVGEESNVGYYAFMTIMYGMISPMALSTKHIFIRYYKKGYNTWDMALDGLILEYMLYAILCLYIFVLSS